MLCALLVLGVFPSTALAKDDEGAESLGYVVSTVRSGKQIDPEKTYFYLKTVPGEEQELKVKVKSTQKEPIKIKVYSEDAYTGVGGTIEYTEDKKLLDATLEKPITSLVKIETPSITVENFEEKEAIIKLTPPIENYSGVKMGVLVFELDDGDSKEMVSSKFAYRVGLMISETGDDYLDSKTLHLLEAKSTIVRGKKMILANLQNPEPKVLANMEMVAEVKSKGSQTVLKKKAVQNYSMAPNSSFNFEIDWGTAAVNPGAYTLTLTAANEYNDWKFEKDFTISGTQARKMNEESAFKIITPTWIKVGAIVALILTGIIVVLIFSRRKKMEAEWKKRRKKRKKRKKKKEGN
ncbi:DUF916 and DUF3324 domain-containing protein [Enterococcus rivorum]